MARQTIEQYYLEMLHLVASRATCRRRKVASIITDEQGRVLSTGYNGVPSGAIHCIDSPCSGVKDLPGSTDRCLAIHAEQNALLQCRQIDRAHTIYCSVSPCFTCCKLIANTPIQRIIFAEQYSDERGLWLLITLKRKLISGSEVWDGHVG
jgi:dCMP deaminase